MRKTTVRDRLDLLRSSLLRPVFGAVGWTAFAGGCLAAAALHGASAWPAETTAQSVKLTALDPSGFSVNVSGAAWNPTNRTLWLASNSGIFWCLVEDGAGSFLIATNSAGTRAKWSPGGDLEGICHVDYAQPTVFLLNEDGQILEYSTTAYGVNTALHTWSIAAHCPEIGGSGPEGITFVPDDWLRRESFRRSDGALCVSTNGMGGLMFVGHQTGGYIHVFDLNRTNNRYGYVGRYKTGRSETADLAFDPGTGRLYVWHNTGANYLEVCELNSYLDGADRRLRPQIEYTGPRSGNLEGFALVSTPGTDDWCFVTDDDNSGGEAVMWFRNFRPTEDADADGLDDPWEMRYFGTLPEADGTTDSDGDGHTNSQEATAGTDPTNRLSRLSIAGWQADASASGWVLSWASVAGRTYEIRRAGVLTDPFTQRVATAIAATPPLNTVTMSVSGVSFYRVAVQ